MKSLSLRIRAVLAGVFILTAYGVLISMMTESPIVICLADLISGLSVIGIAVLLYPLLKNSGTVTSSSYLLLKLLEGLLMLAGGILILFPATAAFRDWIYDAIHFYTFIISAFLLYVLIHRSQIIPRFIAFWGYAAVAFLALSAILDAFDAKPAFLDAFLVLIITNEVFMACWLMFKGVRVDES